MVEMPVGCNPEFFVRYSVLFLSEPLCDSSDLCFTTGTCFPPLSTLAGYPILPFWMGGSSSMLTSLDF